MAESTTVDWPRAQQALRDEVQRVTALLRSAPRPTGDALGVWDGADVAMHLSQVWMAVPGLARGDLSHLSEIVPTLTGETGPSLISDMEDLSGLTTQAVKSDDERALSVLADRIDQRAREFFDESVGRSAGEPRSWILKDASVPLSTLTCHLLNETIVHGYDIARMIGQRWRIEPSHAALVLEGFIVPVIRAVDPRAFVNPDKASGLRATYDVRFRGAGRHLFVFNDGALTVERPSSRKVDCHISADPVALLLVTWARKSQWGPIATGKLVAWGRKPWLGFRFRSLLRIP